ncbi:MAG: amidohydrolase [Paenibacillus sp.]|jgi:predicted TIM-barrel fold metal-dependent hydrolase|nr:amidohydrolase [Paenibacillus sp.]
MVTDMKIIDVDVHNQLRSPRDLQPYLRQPWKSQGIALPSSGYPSPISMLRPNCTPPGGGPAASDAEYLVRDLIVPHGIEYAIMTGNMYDVSVLLDPDHAAAIASAYNDYMAEQWLPKHPSFRGSIVIGTQDPIMAAREIDRMADHPRMACIVLSSAQPALLGQRRFHPIYEAAERRGLPIAIHPGAEGAGSSPPPTPAGYPTHFLEYQMRISQSYMGHMISLVCEGVPEKFPGLKFAMLGGGISWLPHLIWRLDKNFKGLRSTVPWLKRFPSEYIRDHFLFSTQPMEDSIDPKPMLQLFEMIDAENILMFSSDYPNDDNDIQNKWVDALRPEARHKIYCDNAKKLYRL